MPRSSVLLTRLVPPRPPPNCLKREALVARIRSGMEQGRLVTVLAGAGCGKSTAIALALEARPSQRVWVSCDERLGGAGDLLAHISAGVERLVPGFAAGRTASATVEGEVASLCNEIVATLADDVVLVLDDVHLLDSATTAAVALLVRDLPASVHLVLAGRMPLGFALGKVRAGQLAAVTAQDLALSGEEVAALWEAAGNAVDAEAIKEVHARTEGWITGVVLAAQRGNPTLDRRHDSDQLFGYLAEEVLAAQPEELQDFMLQTAILGKFSPALAEAMTGARKSQALCRQLVARNLFVVRLDAEGEWYRYHHLFQSFLQDRLAEAEADLVPALHRRAATAWLTVDEPAEAVDHLLVAGDLESAADLVEGLADLVRLTSQAGLLDRWLATLPEELNRGRPSLTLARAISTFWAGDEGRGFELLNRAIEDFLAVGEDDHAAAAFFALIYAQLASGTRQSHAIDVGFRQLPRVSATARLLPASMVLMASELGCAARYDEADRMLGSILDLRMPSIDPLGQGYLASARALFLDHPQGRSKQALTTMEWVIGLFERNARHDELAYILALRCYRAILLNHLGRYDETLAELSRVTDSARERGVAGGIDRVLLKLRAVALAGLERWDELEEELAAGEPVDSLLGSSYGIRTRAPAAKLAVHRGDVGAVAHHANVAMKYVNAFGFSFDAPGWVCDIAVAAWQVGLEGEARRLYEHVLVGAERARSPWARARGQLLGSVLLDEAAADAALSEALALTAEWGMEEIWTRRDRPLVGRALGRAILAGIGADGLAARLAARAGAEVLDACASVLARAPSLTRLDRLAALEAAGMDDADVRARLGAPAGRSSRGDGLAMPRAALSINALGGFVVRRGGEAIPVSAFGRERARAVLSALVCARGAVHREQLLDWLWPILDAERGLRALHVTLHSLRRALEPGLGRGGTSRSVIRSEGESYRLHLGDGDTIDVREFLSLSQADGDIAVGEMGPLLAAERMYTGSVYPEWRYAEWTHECRAEVERSYADLLGRLAETFVRLGRYGEAVRRFERLVTLEPERESTHRSLMLTYARSGDKALALRQYHACRAVLRRELGVEASLETRGIYQLILDDQPLPEPTAAGSISASRK